MPKILNPLYIVIVALGFVEHQLIGLYPSLVDQWEKISVLAVLVTLPSAVIAAFLYVWITRPGFLYTPSEFGSDGNTPIKLEIFDGPAKLGPGAKFETSIADLWLRVNNLEQKVNGSVNDYY